MRPHFTSTPAWFGLAESFSTSRATESLVSLARETEWAASVATPYSSREGYAVFLATKNGDNTACQANLSNAILQGVSSPVRPESLKSIIKIFTLDESAARIWESLVICNDMGSESTAAFSELWDRLTCGERAMAIAPSDTNDYVDRYCEWRKSDAATNGLIKVMDVPRSLRPSYVAQSLFEVRSLQDFDFLRWCGKVWQDCVTSIFPLQENEHRVMEFSCRITSQECWFDIADPGRPSWFVTFGKLSDGMAFLGSRDKDLLASIEQICSKLVVCAC